MLLNLHVKNMALIRELDVDFTEGLNILSGETGAGKSIILGSINVALGMQSFKGFAREDADSALVELVFSAETAAIRQKMEQLDLPLEDGQLILSRRMANNRSISKVNGETVPVSVIRELASVLIDIHGQHEHQSLLYQKNHLKILDEFAGAQLQPLKENGAVLYETYAACKKELESARLDETQRRKELDFLQYEVEEIDNCNLHPGEDESLEQQFKRMANAKRIAQDASEAYQLLSEGRENASDLVSRALQRIAAVGAYDERLSVLNDQLAEVESLLTDFNRELSDYLEELTFDEQEFSQVEERLDTINHMKIKYGNSIAQILAYRDEKEARLQQLFDYDTYLAKLEKQYEESEQRLRENAQAMSKIRARFAEQLSVVIQEELQDLNFLETKFAIRVEQTAALGANGFDEVCFLISLNPGSPLRPLADVASGGELSRIMLALKTVLAEKDEMPSLIFDEIDVGISGRTAQKVSEKMALIGRNHQVLCITHLAQIASMADSHFLIEKTVQDGKTMTRIRPLEKEESIEELARILGGAQITELTMQSAREMKELAETAKKY
ncbi:MAG: DNA repair protein RecN [Marvinbryantia sp.]|jgi:DNA repair protein RecN (Recombination protein N)